MKAIQSNMIDKHKKSWSMMLGQRVRDAVMARAMIVAGAESPTILIAGSGHTRADFGVPAYIKGRQPDAKITAIVMV